MGDRICLLWRVFLYNLQSLGEFVMYIAAFISNNFVVITLVCIALSIALMFLIRKGFGLQSLRYHHEVSDPLLACVGTLFAVLLGFMVANAMNRYDQARLNIEQEAGALGDIFRLAGGLKDGEKIERDCLAYADVVMNEGWADLEKRKMNEHAWNAYGQIWQDVLNYNPGTQRESNIHQSMLEGCTHLGDARRIRATQLNYQLPPILWAVVILGAIATAILAHFFGIHHTFWQIATNTLVTIVLCLNVFLLASFDDPFSGIIRLQPIPFQVARDSFQKVLDKRMK